MERERDFFIEVTLMMALVMVYANYKFHDHFSGVTQYQKQVASLESELDREQFRHLLTQTQLSEFKQHVAVMLPEAIEKKGEGERSYPLRQLASVVGAADYDKVRLAQSNRLYEQATQAFRKSQYDRSNAMLSKLLRLYPFSPKIVDAYFLLVEGQFQLRQYEDCVATVNHMVELFPESELTGFALLRVGKIYESQYRKQEAVEIYQTILRLYPQRELASQANHSLKAVDL